MRIIELNAKNWLTRPDFYNALLAALGAPEGHGRNLNALIDSMVWGGMNTVETPYTIHISETEKLSKDVLAEIDELKLALASACAERRELRSGDVEIGFEITA
jgi:RNAse (barnase) inhibitor barstar